MNNQNSNPKALNLTDINFNGKKLTLGFKCSPALKYNLGKKAQALKLSLSSYVENLVEYAENERDEMIATNQKQLTTINQQNSTIAELEKTLAIYQVATEIAEPETYEAESIIKTEAVATTELPKKIMFGWF